MDINEIRNGNYVVSRGELTRVRGLRTDTEDPCVLCENSDVWVPVETLEPVGLNKDILETNGFRMSDDKSYGIFKSVFKPFGDHNIDEFEDYIAIDLVVRPACLVKHQYVVNTNGKGKGIKDKSFNGEILYAHELQNIMYECGCTKELIIDRSRW